MPTLRELAAKYGWGYVVETGTGPESSGLQVAANLGLEGFTCDVFGPCVEAAQERFPQQFCYHGESLRFLETIVPRLTLPTFFWLDGHCPTDQSCLPCPIYPPFEEIQVLKKWKPGLERDTIWLDDFSMVDVPDNPIATSWDVDLAGKRWQGAKEHSFADYVALLDATHTHEIVGPTLRFTPR